MPEAIKLYEELHEDVRHYLNSLLADKNVSDIELADEIRVMARIMAEPVFNLLAIGDDPVMMPVYAHVCRMISDTITNEMISIGADTRRYPVYAGFRPTMILEISKKVENEVIK